jgi:hypothetical protein
MVERVACIECGALILPTTAEDTGGRCMPCRNGTREQIEAGKRYNEHRKQYDPFREHWISLVGRVHKTDAGFNGLTPDEKLYFAVGLVDLDVTNGGTHQYFSNSAGEYYSFAISGLERIGATQTLDLLRRAKNVLFGDNSVPTDANARWDAMKQYPVDMDENVPEWCTQLEEIDNLLWDDPDGLNDLLCQFAESNGMIEPFRKPENAG